MGSPLVSEWPALSFTVASTRTRAEHSETRGEPITVSESAFLITAIPEGGTLIPGLENQVFLLASYPDGSPVDADLRVRSNVESEQSVRTDEGGVAVINLRTPQGGETLQIEGKDNEGETVSAKVPLQLRAGDDQVLLRSDRAVYRSGDAIHLKVLTTMKHGTAYVVIVKEGQTILPLGLEINDGKAELTLAAGPEMAGTEDVNAYIFGRNAQPVG